MSEVIPTTRPRKISKEILTFCREISPGRRPIYIPVQSTADTKARDCFANVGSVVKEKGGSAYHGWLIWEIPNVMLEAEFHAVWRSPDGKLIDVTPNLLNESRVLFLPHEQLAYAGEPVDNVRKALTDDQLTREFIRRAEALFELQKPYQVGEEIHISREEFKRLLPNHAEFVTAFKEFVKSKRGRNDPCICGSGRKYKSCCGR